MIFNLKLNYVDHVDVVRILIEKEIDINGQNSEKGSAALHLAAATGEKIRNERFKWQFFVDSIALNEKWFPSRKREHTRIAHWQWSLC